MIRSIVSAGRMTLGAAHFAAKFQYKDNGGRCND